MKWSDTRDIAMYLDEKFPSIEILTIRFTDLYKWVIELPTFSDDPNNCNEKYLEGIQMAWLEERELNQ